MGMEARVWPNGFASARPMLYDSIQESEMSYQLINQSVRGTVQTWVNRPAPRRWKRCLQRNFPLHQHARVDKKAQHVKARIGKGDVPEGDGKFRNADIAPIGDSEDA